MTTISPSTALTGYLANAAKPASSSPAQASNSAGTSDAVAQLRSYAQQLVSSSQGGLLRAYQAQQSAAGVATFSGTALSSQPSSTSSQIALPDVADLDRDDAAKLMQQIDKLLASDQVSALKFVGFNADKQTESLSTYRTWLQDKGGISVHV
jgi:hypothetical protein